MFKIGCEFEINNEERFFNYDSINKYIESGSWENDIIKEFKIKPVFFKNQRNFLRRFLLLTDVLCSDFNYKYGENDNLAESNHLHLTFKSKISLKFLNSLIIYLPFFSRQNSIFRDAVRYRASLHYQNTIIYNSKDYWVTYKDYIHNLMEKWIEIRVNENPFPLLPIYFIDFAFFLYKSKDKFISDLIGDINKKFKTLDYFRPDLDNFKFLSYLKLYLNYIFKNDKIYTYYKYMYKNNFITTDKIAINILRFYQENFLDDIYKYNMNKQIFEYCLKNYQKLIK